MSGGARGKDVAVKKRVLAALVVGLLGSPRGAAAQDWESIKNAEGVQVWQQTVPGTSLVRFRAVGVVDAPIDRVIAVMFDHNRAVEWSHACVESVDLEVTDRRARSYNHTGSPAFFVSDRDVVLETTLSSVPETKSIRGDFQRVDDPRRPVRDGIVRLPTLVGYFAGRQVDRDHTEVTYEVQTDPGGSIPSWLVNWAARDLPFGTLVNLRVQVTKGGYDAQMAYVRHVLDLRGFVLAAAE